MRVNFPCPNPAKFFYPESGLWPNSWPHKFSHKYFIWAVLPIVFVILTASTHPNCKSWGIFEKFRKFDAAKKDKEPKNSTGKTVRWCRNEEESEGAE